jgi:hypothetical protein
MAHKHQEAPNFKYNAEKLLPLVEKIFACPEFIATLLRTLELCVSGYFT